MYDEDLVSRTRPLLAQRGDLSEKKMFGGLAFLVGGHMAVAVSRQGGLMVRVPPARHKELLAERGSAPMEMGGRSVDGWLRVDAGAVADDDELAYWVGIGVDCAAGLPPK